MFSLLRPISVAIVLAGCAQSWAAPPKPTRTVQFGIAESMFEGVPESFRDVTSQPFLRLVKAGTGFDGKLQFPPDAVTLADLIDKGKIDIGVFKGYEFAFAQGRHPKLVPILIAAQHHPVQIVAVVRDDRRGSTMADLASDKIAVDPLERDLCGLFLAKEKRERLNDRNFTTHDASNGSNALFEVIDGKSGGAVVNLASLKSFQQLYPGKAKNLRVLAQTRVLPDSCVAVKAGGLDESAVRKFREALTNVEKLPGGKPLLVLWKLKGFAVFPADYEKSLSQVRDTFSQPAREAALTGARTQAP